MTGCIILGLGSCWDACIYKTYNKNIGALYPGGPRWCSQKVPWKGAVDNCWAAPCWQQREGAEERRFSCIVLSPLILDRAGETVLDHNRVGRQRWIRGSKFPDMSFHFSRGLWVIFTDMQNVFSDLHKPGGWDTVCRICTS